jgi:hypothetical protein
MADTDHRRHGIAAIAVEDLNFADARGTGRETMGRGRRGKRFRRTVAGIPTGVFRDRLTVQVHRQGTRLYAADPVAADQAVTPAVSHVDRDG